MKKLFILMLSGLIFLFTAASLRAATVYIYWDSDTGFTSDSVNIDSGDTVIWVDVDSFDLPVQITSDSPLFSFGLAGYGDYNGYIFTGSGTIGYHDNYGYTGTITFNSAPPPPPTPAVLSQPRMSAGKFLFDASVTTNKTTVLEVSTNLIAWLPIQTNVPNTTSLTFTNSAAARAQFFRIRQIN
jgi:hypothetical protein